MNDLWEQSLNQLSKSSEKQGHGTTYGKGQTKKGLYNATDRNSEAFVWFNVDQGNFEFLIHNSKLDKRIIFIV